MPAVRVVPGSTVLTAGRPGRVVLHGAATPPPVETVVRAEPAVAQRMSPAAVVPAVSVVRPVVVVLAVRVLMVLML